MLFVKIKKFSIIVFMNMLKMTSIYWPATWIEIHNKIGFRI